MDSFRISTLISIHGFLLSLHWFPNCISVFFRGIKWVLLSKKCCLFRVYLTHSHANLIIVSLFLLQFQIQILEKHCSFATLSFFISIQQPCDNLLILKWVLLIRITIAGKFHNLFNFCLYFMYLILHLLLQRICGMMPFLEGHSLLV